MSYRYHFKPIDSSKCRTCGADDSILHRICICRSNIMGRITSRRKIIKINIRLQLGSTLRKAQALRALLRVFQTASDYVPKILRRFCVTEYIRETQIIKTFCDIIQEKLPAKLTPPSNPHTLRSIKRRS